jgi:hypothetical protein
VCRWLAHQSCARLVQSEMCCLPASTWLHGRLTALFTLCLRQLTDVQRKGKLVVVWLLAVVKPPAHTTRVPVQIQSNVLVHVRVPVSHDYMTDLLLATTTIIMCSCCCLGAGGNVIREQTAEHVWLIIRKKSSSRRDMWAYMVLIVPILYSLHSFYYWLWFFNYV